MLRLGIDEAGYGPTLGPLAIVAACADPGDPVALSARLRDLGVADSKQVHASGDLAPLERVALPGLAWLSGLSPTSAADVFALLGEPPASREGVPWMAGAEALRLPLAAGTVPEWNLPHGEARGMRGRLLHPRQLNAHRRQGVNRAAAELDVVRELLAAAIPDPAVPAVVTCDRLGGRKRYGDLLARAWPGCAPLTVEETSPACRYRSGMVDVAFLVGGEDAEPLVALASCIAKYARELHMHLLNSYWCQRFRWLKPTAGYPEDAKRWLHQLGAGNTSAWQDDLIRTGNATP
jgi:ribonuclease HII